MTAEDFLDAPGPTPAGMPADKPTAEAFLGEAPPQTFASGFKSGFAGKDQAAGFTAANAGEELGRNALPILGGTIGGLAGPVASAAGAGAGRMAQNVAQSYMSNTDLGAHELLVSPVVEGAGQYLGGKLLENAVVPFGRAVVKRAASTISGVPGEAFERLVQRPAEVLSAWARDPESPAHYAGVFKDAVAENMKRAGDAYEAIIDSALKRNATFTPMVPNPTTSEVGQAAASVAPIAGAAPDAGEAPSLNGLYAQRKRLTDALNHQVQVARNFAEQYAGKETPGSLRELASRKAGIEDAKSILNELDEQIQTARNAPPNISVAPSGNISTTQSPAAANMKHKRFNLLRGIGNKLADIVDDYGFGNPNRLTNKMDGADIFNSINQKIQSMTNASTEDIYYLQRDLSNLARQYIGTPLGSAIGKTKSALMDYIGRRIPEIGQANAIYASAKGLEEEAAPLLNSTDLPAKIAHAYRRNTEVKAAAETVANGIPAARQALEQLRDATAGQAFAPGLANMPRTGLATGLGALGLGAAHLNPVAVVGAAMAAPFLSPRLTGTLVGAASMLGKYATGQGIGPAALQAAYSGTRTAATAPVSLSLMEAYRRRQLAP